MGCHSNRHVQGPVLWTEDEGMIMLVSVCCFPLSLSLYPLDSSHLKCFIATTIHQKNISDDGLRIQSIRRLCMSRKSGQQNADIYYIFSFLTIHHPRSIPPASIFSLLFFLHPSILLSTDSRCLSYTSSLCCKRNHLWSSKEKNLTGWLKHSFIQSAQFRQQAQVDKNTHLLPGIVLLH